VAKASIPTKRVIQRCPKGALHLELLSNAPGGGGRGVWYARVPHEHTIDDVTSPDYFGAMQIAKGGLQANDVIEVENESASYSIRLRVMAVVPELQQIRTREVMNLRQIYEVTPPEGFSFVWRGGEAKWVLMHGDTVVSAGCASQDEAMARYEIVNRDAA
jgi:hypothetical protein